MSINEVKEGVNEKDELLVKNKNINSGELLNQAKGDFIDEKLEYNTNYFNIESSDFEENTYNDFFNYVNSNSKYSYLAFHDLAGYTLDQKNTLAKQLKQDIIKEKVSLDKNTKTIIDIFHNEFNFETDSSRSELELKIDKLSFLDMKKLLNSELNRLKFINKLKINGIVKKDNKEKSGILEKINIDDIKTENLTQEQLIVLNKFSNIPNTLSNKEYIILLSILTNNEREFLLEYLNTTFSLNDLIKHDILGKKEAIGYLVENYREIYPRLDVDELYLILNDNLDFENVYISTKELRYEHISKILKERRLLEDFFGEINEYKLEQQKAISNDFYDNIELEYPKLDLDENGKHTEKGLIHNNFKHFLNSNVNKENISKTTLDSLDHFDKGNYIEIVNEGKKSYFYISEIDVGGTKEGKHIVVNNLTSDQNLSKIRSLDVADKDNISYKEFYYILKNSKKDGSNIKFIKKEDFSSLDVEEVDDKDNIKSESDLLEKLFSEKIIDSEYLGLGISNLALLDKTVGNKKIGNVSSYRTFSVDESTNSITFDITGQKVSFSEFFDVLINKKDSFSFEKKINSGVEVLKKIGLNDNYELDGDKLFYIDKDKEKKEVNYFIGKDGEALNITSISEFNIEFSYGKIKKNKDKKGNQIFEAKYSNKGFNNFVKDVGTDLKPDLKGIKLQDSDDKYSHKSLEESKWSLGSVMNAWMSCLSISEVISAGNMYVDALKNHLEMGNQLKASRLAEKFGSVSLPQSVRVKLKTHTESESKKLMEDLKGKVLTELNSDDAFEYINKNILENKHAETYEIFAAMSFMLEKSGSLSAKGLLKNRGSFLWYQKLGGTVGDDFFREQEAKFTQAKFNKKEGGNDDPSFFTEEALVEVYLAKLSKEGKIFSRADKDFSALRAKGHERRFKKGSDEASTDYTVTSRIDYFMAHLGKGEDDRALGALGKILGKNKGDPAIMNKAPFILAMGGFGKYYDGTNVGRLVQTAFETPYISVYFGVEQDLIDTYQGAIKQYFINKGENSKAEELDIILSKKTGDKVKALGAFWDRNGKDLVDFINFKDGNILLQKGTDKDPNGYYQDFYNTVNGVFNDGEFDHTKGEYLQTYMYNESAFASVGAKLSGAKYLRSDQAFGYGDKYSGYLAKVYFARLKDIKDNSNLSMEDKYKLFSDIYDKFEDKVRNAFGGYIDRIDFNNPKGDFPKDLYNYNLILDYGDNKRDNRNDFLRHAFDYFMNNEIIKSNKIEDEADDNKDKVLDIMDYSSENYEDYGKGDETKKEKEYEVYINNNQYKKV